MHTTGRSQFLAENFDYVMALTLRNDATASTGAGWIWDPGKLYVLIKIAEIAQCTLNAFVVHLMNSQHTSMFCEHSEWGHCAVGRPIVAVVYMYNMPWYIHIYFGCRRNSDPASHNFTTQGNHRFPTRTEAPRGRARIFVY